MSSKAVRLDNPTQQPYENNTGSYYSAQQMPSKAVRPDNPTQQSFENSTGSYYSAQQVPYKIGLKEQSGAITYTEDPPTCYHTYRTNTF